MSIASYVVASTALQALDARANVAMLAAQPARVSPDGLTQPGAATRECERAAADCGADGQPYKANWVRAVERRSGQARGGTIRPEFERLRVALHTTPSGTLEPAEPLVELAELHLNADDEFEAAPLPREAEDKRSGLGLTDVDGASLASAAATTSDGLASGALKACSTPLNGTMRARRADPRLPWRSGRDMGSDQLGFCELAGTSSLWESGFMDPERGMALALNVAATCIGTRALGPGSRSVVWVQGCPFRCRGCIAPDWIPQTPARQLEPSTLAAELLTDPAVTGLTFSGGEPMLQAAGLAAVARHARSKRDVSLICFTGFRLERLRSRPPTPGVPELLLEVDVLIDGLYVASRDDGRGLRGSANQRVHHLTDRLAQSADELAAGPRSVEIGIAGREALLIGVPPPGVAAAFDLAVDRVRRAQEVPA